MRFISEAVSRGDSGGAKNQPVPLPPLPRFQEDTVSSTLPEYRLAEAERVSARRTFIFK